MLLWPAMGDVRTPADPPLGRACVGLAVTPAGVSPPPDDATDLLVRRLQPTQPRLDVGTTQVNKQILISVMLHGI